MAKKNISQLREDAKRLFLHGVEAVNPHSAIKRSLRLENRQLVIGGDRDDALKLDLQAFERIFVLGMGKATALMAKATEETLKDRITDGCIVVKYGYSTHLAKIRTHEAGHPLPDEKGLKGAQEIARIAGDAGENDLILFLISGGGSALLPLPGEGITLEEKQKITQQLLACGADIQEINAIRKHISSVKGGQLARLAYPATIVSLILSDVVGDRLDTIASGTTVSDNTTFQEAFSIIEKYGLIEEIPVSIKERITQGAAGTIEDTPKRGDKIFEKTHNLLVGSNIIALQAIKNEAQRTGYNTVIITSSIEGEAREVAKVHSAIAKEVIASGNPVTPPACVISGGETTVTITGKGKGGRNQELCLAAAMAINGIENIVIMSAGTDGTDGPTDAAGGIIDGTTCRRAEKQGINAVKSLRNNDSYDFLKKTGDLLITGPTNTNVMDIHIILAA
ncbi:glycerate kinase [candidate division WOR-3 bacterium]|nr:glycerate kinase [candidate division WOR-3 bacterium]